MICKYKGFVWSIVNKVLIGRYQDVEECVSDVFFHFWKYRHSLDIESGSIKGLLAYMTRNTAIIFCVYEAKQREQIVMADYMEVMKKRELKTGKKIVLGTYNPLSSTVPGYPVVISNSKKIDRDVKFSISASEGQLLKWNAKMGDIQELGKSGIFTGNEKLFWSPLNNEKLVKETKIKVNLFIKEQLVDTVLVKIVMETEGTYTAKQIIEK